MILVGIDVAKDKHDCFICNSEGEALCKTFSFPNSMEGFNDLYVKIKSFSEDLSKLKVGLEATGHYSYNLLGFLLNKGLPTFVINPLHTKDVYKRQVYFFQCCNPRKRLFNPVLVDSFHAIF